MLSEAQIKAVREIIFRAEENKKESLKSVLCVDLQAVRQAEDNYLKHRRLLSDHVSWLLTDIIFNSIDEAEFNKKVLLAIKSIKDFSIKE